MSIIHIPTIEGDKNPYVGFALHYELKIDKYYSVRWRMLNKDGTSLNDRDMRLFEKFNTPYVDFIFLDAAAKNVMILEALYKIEESDCERMVAISITPVLGAPAILTAIWQNAKGQDISCFSLETVCLAIRTVNIPVGRKLKVLLYDNESILSDKFAIEMSVSVGVNGKALLIITREVWLKIRRNLKSQIILPFEDSQYQIYARVLYHPVALSGHSAEMKEVEKKSSILIMNNNQRKSLEALATDLEKANKSVVVNVPDKNITEGKAIVDLRIDVYFDGTMGNRWNIDAKNDPDKILEDGESARTKLKRNKAEYMLTEKKDNSYNQVYTNIPIMFDLDKTIEKNREFKVYVEGVGSRKYGEDEAILGAGAGTDMGGTGIPSKIQRMLDEIRNRVRLGKKKEPGEVKIVVFGFSRGATTARSFLSHRGDIARVLKTSEANISFEFVGIFDTVSSVFSPDVKGIVPVLLPIGPLGPLTPAPMPVFDRDSVKTAMNNVEGLNLEIGANAKKVVHLTAGDEYRSFFKLTNIASSINADVGFELELPGSHCDIGGGNKDNMIEHLWVANYKGLADRLIKEGWHTGKKLVEVEVPNTEGISVPYYDYITGNIAYGRLPYIVEKHWCVKRTVKEGYHKIPLLIMKDFAEKYGKVVYESLKETYAIPGDLQDLSDRMLSFAQLQSGKRQASAMSILNEPQFQWVRNKYLHLSAFPESGKNYEKNQKEDTSSESENDKMSDMVKDTVWERNIIEELSECLPFMDSDYSKRPERGINEG